ncbi:MAG: hypothetical protein WC829_02700 [Hyphomicrobium sp.]|jgi:hypothetical protein
MDWPSIPDIDAAGPDVLRHWWRVLPVAETPEQEAVIERLCARAEGMGLVGVGGKTGGVLL